MIRVTVYYKIIEGNKERIQQYQVWYCNAKAPDLLQTFTVRKISNGVGVERIFPLQSPKIDKIVVDKRGIVRRACIFYLRGISGKSPHRRKEVLRYPIQISLRTLHLRVGFL